MNTDTCQTIEKWLVDFADGALPSEQAACVQAHLNQCPTCRVTVEALQQSLETAQTIWRDNTRDVGQTVQSRSHNWRYVAVAASILLVVGTLTYWFARRPPSAPALTLAQIENRIAEAGRAARLLARVQQLETQTARLDMAKNQYQYIAERYPDTAAAKSARLKLKSLP